MLPSAVLVVDPSPITANRVREALAGSGLELVIATDRVQADAALKRPDLGVLLVSTHFPGGDGYAFASVAHTRHDQAVIFLLCAGSENFDEARAAAAGVDGPIVRPFSVETVRRHIEAVYGPLSDELPAIEVTPVAPGGEPDHAPTAPIHTGKPDPVAAVGDERLATFLPRDWRTYPPVRVDPKVVGPAVERAILEVLPEVVEIVLAKALGTSRSFKDLVEASVADAVREQLPGLARRAIRERLAEIEATGGE